ncbi:single-stranded-DNA-specific exonuclease RecJ, partial [Enterococcus faecium]
HLKFVLSDASSQLDAVAFGFGTQEEVLLNNQVDVVGKLSINEWNRRKKPQLMVSDFSVGGLHVFDWRAIRFREQSRT